MFTNVLETLLNLNEPNFNIKNISKKNFSDPLNDILNGGAEAPQSNEREEATTSQEPKRGVGRPKKDKSKQPESEHRTYILKTEILQKLKLISLKEGLSQTEVLEYALTQLIDRYEKKHGTLDVAETPKSLEEIF